MSIFTSSSLRSKTLENREEEKGSYTKGVASMRFAEYYTLLILKPPTPRPLCASLYMETREGGWKLEYPALEEKPCGVRLSKATI